MRTSRRRRQQGLIREALYIFLAIALVMAVLLDGLAVFTAQQGAREDASEAGKKAKEEYAQSSSVDRASKAAEQRAQRNGGEMTDFSSSAGSGAASRSFTVTVRRSADTYLFRYLEYIPGLDDWAKDISNPTITRTTL